MNDEYKEILGYKAEYCNVGLWNSGMSKIIIEALISRYILGLRSSHMCITS